LKKKKEKKKVINNRQKEKEMKKKKSYHGPAQQGRRGVRPEVPRCTARCIGAPNPNLDDFDKK
jgi:hypothetical protein